MFVSAHADPMWRCDPDPGDTDTLETAATDADPALGSECYENKKQKLSFTYFENKTGSSVDDFAYETSQ